MEYVHHGHKIFIPNLKHLVMFLVALAWVTTSYFFVTRLASVKMELPAKSAYVLYGSNVRFGPSTQEFINNLVSEDVKPVLVDNTKKDFFSVEGQIIAVGKSNIQVFEYPDMASARLDVVAFQKSANTRYGAWKKRVHLFTKDNLIIFYMYDNKEVLRFLRSVAGSEILT